MPGVQYIHELRNDQRALTHQFKDLICYSEQVIHAGLLDFHKVLQDAISLDEMISIHRSHLERLTERCLLQPTVRYFIP
jgi:hypothetical protein